MSKKQSFPTQEDRVLQYLQTHPKGITSLDAFEKLHITRLSARIFNLKEMGHIIHSIREKTIGEHGEVHNFVRYKL